MKATISSFPVYTQSGSTPASGDVPYLWLTVLFTAIVFTLEIYLDFRQLRMFDAKTAKVPLRLKDVIKQDTFDKSIAYRKDMFSFKIIEGTYAFVTSIFMILLGYLPYTWDTASTASSVLWIGLGYEYVSPFYQEVTATWLFVLLFTLVDILMSLPFSLYSTFVLEERHGFNKSTLSLYFQDKLTMLSLTAVLTFPVLGAVIYIVKTFVGEYTYLFVWLFLCLVSIILMIVYPVLIAPLFNKYTELEDAATKKAIQVSTLLRHLLHPSYLFCNPNPIPSYYCYART
jgi:STE24 endopeptidase